MDIREGAMSGNVRGMIKIDRRRLLKTVFYLYLFFVFSVVAVKFTGNNLNEIMRRWDIISSAKEAGERNINLVPFQTISNYMRHFSRSYAYTNIIGNFVVFIPFGFLFPIVYPKKRNFFKVFGSCFLVVIGIELFQYLTCLGFCDVDDLILNMLSCIVGYVLYAVIVYRKKRISGF